MNDKFVLIVPKSTSADGWCVVKIPADCYNKLLSVKQKTGVALGSLTERCVNFALERLEIVEEES